MITLVLPLGTTQAESFGWREFRQQVGSAILANEADALRQLRGELETHAPEPVSWRHYWSGLLSFRAGLLAWPGDEAERLFKDCTDAAQAAIDAGEDSGESLALLGGCYGQLARGGLMAGMRYGSKAGNAADDSLVDAPDNPRVLLLAGIRDLYTPIVFGGDPEHAARRLERTRQILASEDADDDQPWLPEWGRADAHGHLALALAELGRHEDARRVLSEARAAGLRPDWLDSISRHLEAVDQ